MSMLEEITPVILTFNEAPNIVRCLDKLRWAQQVIVVDSGSTDQTLRLIEKFKNVRVHSRAFDSHSKQWTFAVQQTGIQSEWVLALDADYILSEELIKELQNLKSSAETSAYRANFRYCLLGRNLRASVYPPVTVLFRKENSFYEADGHTQRLRLKSGNISSLKAVIIHDDRKPFKRWLESQKKYMTLEALKLKQTPFSSLNAQDRVRKIPFVAPFIMIIYCLFIRGLVLDGKAGFYYTYQRFLAEWLLSYYRVTR
jgi:glycosyltransferase involved in cell wall biosynthesis